MSLTSKQIDELRAYAKSRKGELAKLINDAADTIELLSAKLHASQMERSSQYYHDGWIPCEEKMPEEHEWIGTLKFGTTISDEVYVTFENPKGERFCKHIRFQNGELSNYDKREIDICFKGSKPIAWRPLPEPYRKEGEGR